MKKTVYFVTTIPSYLFDNRKEIQLFIDITKKWWKEESKKYLIVTSDKRNHIRFLNTKLGLFIPEIITPLELFEESKDVYQ